MISNGLFDQIEREDTGPAKQYEPEFKYINRTSRIEFQRVRIKVEEWYKNLPRHQKDDLRGRFRSNNNNQHHSAFFELLLSQILHKLNYNYLPHPDTPGHKTKRPDYLVWNDNERSFVECITITGQSDEEVHEQELKNRFIEKLNELHLEGFLLAVSFRGHTSTPIPAVKIKQAVFNNLRVLDYRLIVSLVKAKGLDGVPAWSFKHSNMTIKIRPIPLNESRAKDKGPGRMVGIIMEEPRWDNSKDVIRKALLRKAGRYGELNEPYLIALNIRKWGPDIDDVMEALFGDIVYPLPENALHQDTILQGKRKLNGVWLNTDGKRYTRLSAILVFFELFYTKIPTSYVTLIHNPWAEYPITALFNSFPQTRIGPEGLAVQAGLSLGDVLDLHKSWPLSTD